MNAVDTNILLYLKDPRDPRKQAIAASLIESLTDGVLLWQVACEYLAASRKLNPVGYSLTLAWQDIQDFQQVWSTSLPSWKIMNRAEQLLTKYNLSFWDSMIVAAALEAGATRLYSEDFDAYQKLETLELVNPFK